MDNLANIGTVRELCQKYGFSFSKTLGQNFLVNPSVCPRIAEQGLADSSGVIPPHTGVLEIGTGFGVLTTELCRRAERVVAVEIDESLRPVLAETMQGFNNLTIRFADVLKLDLHRLIDEEFPGMRVVVCANLPYYVTSPILMSLLEQRLPIDAITVMVQKEAAQRLCARMGTRECGAVTAAVRYYSDPRVLFPVSRGSFLPSPNVDSSVIRLDIRRELREDVQNEALLFRMIRLGFQNRRKTLANPLSAGLSLPKATVQSALLECGLTATARAEELTLENWIDLANRISPHSEDRL